MRSLYFLKLVVNAVSKRLSALKVLPIWAKARCQAKLDIACRKIKRTRERKKGSDAVGLEEPNGEYPGSNKHDLHYKTYSFPHIGT